MPLGLRTPAARSALRSSPALLAGGWRLRRTKARTARPTQAAARRLRRLAAVRAGAGADALPADRKPRARPAAAQAWSINTHALIEFPPAIAGGVAYVVNKYGNVQGGAAAGPQGSLEAAYRAERQRDKPTDVTAPGLLQRPGLRRLPRRRTCRRSTRRPGRPTGAQPPRPPRILAAGGRRDALHRHRQERAAWRCDAADGKPRVALRRSGGDQSEPELPRRPDLRRRLRGRRCSRSTPAPASRSGAPTPARCAVRQGRLLLLARRSPSAASTPPATTAPSSPSTKDRQGRLVLPDQQPVYGSPALAQVPGTPPTVYIGSYDEHLYALDARTGKRALELRRRRAGARAPRR